MIHFSREDGRGHILFVSSVSVCKCGFTKQTCTTDRDAAENK